MSDEFKNINDLKSRFNSVSLDNEAKKALKEFIRINMNEYLMPSIDDIWYRNENAVSYWLLLINGIDSPREAKIANELLFWREFLVGDDAQLRCLQISDRIMSKFCIKHFNMSTPPVLIFSRDPFFSNYIKLDSELLFELIKEENALRNFVNKIHSELFQGQSLSEINKSFGVDKFWKGLKLVYKEVKSFVSISIDADINKK